MPLVAILLKIDWANFIPLITSESSRAALVLSLKTATASTVVCVLLGVPMALVLARGPFPGQSVLRSLVLLPLVLPPVVGGIALLYTFGRQGLLGQHLEVLGIRIAFSTTAVVLAQTFVALPFLVRQPRGRAAHGGQPYEASPPRSGAGPTTVLRTVTLPLVLPGLMSGAVLAFARVARRVRRHPDVRRQPAGRHPNPAAGDLPAARDRRRRRGGAVAGAGRGRGGDRDRLGVPGAWRARL